jgi:hypothetical protein
LFFLYDVSEFSFLKLTDCQVRSRLWTIRAIMAGVATFSGIPLFMMFILTVSSGGAPCCYAVTSLIVKLVWVTVPFIKFIQPETTSKEVEGTAAPHVSINLTTIKYSNPTLAGTERGTVE